MMSAPPEARFRYSRVSPRRQSETNGGYAKAANILLAPLLGSSLLFPRRFDKVVHELLSGGAAGALAPQYARWYFGPHLHLEVDPAKLMNRISDFVVDHSSVRWIGATFLDAADWSGALAPIKRSPIHREMSEIAIAGSDYRGTLAHRMFLRGQALGRPARRNGVALATNADIDAYFRYCFDLIESIKAHGVVARRTFGRVDLARLKHWQARSPALDRTERDIGVTISAEGELIRHLGGKHRTAIAQALDLPRMPVELRLVHVGWLAREAEATGLPPHRALIAGLKRIASAYAPRS